MTIADIPKVKAGVSTEAQIPASEFTNERMLLAQRASDVLGYRALKADVTGKPMRGAMSGKLTETLLSLDIQVLDSAAVVKYQTEEAGRLTLQAIQEDFQNWSVGYFHPATWARTNLSEYERPIPEFVLDKAVRIKEAVPDVQFYVHHLDDPKADPFLIVRLNKEIYYLDAWDEPRFESNL